MRRLGLVFVLGLAVLGGGADAKTQESNQVATVITMAVRHESLSQMVTVYGKLEPTSKSRYVQSVARQAHLMKLWVLQGEHIRRGEPTARVAMPQVYATYQSAVAQRNAAQKALQQTEQLLKAGLSTGGALAAAQASYTHAQARVDSLKAEGLDRKTRVLRAPNAGVVTSIKAVQGQWLSAGQPILVLTSSRGMMIHLGLTPTEAAKVHAGMTVRLSPIFSLGKANRVFYEHIRSVAGQLNAQTDLVDAAVPVGDRPYLLAGEWLRGQIVIRRGVGLAVPARAVLKDRSGDYVFVISKGRARRVAVTVLFRQGAMDEVTGDLHANQRVVVVGNYELKTGMRVKVIEAK